MPYADHLLEQARHLAHRERKRPRQASLRRAVSTAYYALFHLLISAATLNWKRVDERALLARFFEHGKMRAASERQRGECSRFINSARPPAAEAELNCMRHLHLVAEAFIEAQQQRHAADYDNARQWNRADALSLILQVESAFESWRAIRDEPAAHAYLISLLGNPKAV
jgi:uncharacterized protein (UPF0332 family)